MSEEEEIIEVDNGEQEDDKIGLPLEVKVVKEKEVVVEEDIDYMEHEINDKEVEEFEKDR